MEAGNRGAMMPGTLGRAQYRAPIRAEDQSYVNLPVPFRYFFARKTCFVKYSAAFVFMPAVRHPDEVSELLTLVQTMRVPLIPLIFFDSSSRTV